MGVLSLDSAIHFCAVAHKSGYLISHASNGVDNYFDRNNDDESAEANGNFSQGKEEEPALARSRDLPHLSEAEMEKYTFHSGILCGLHRSWEHKFGRIKRFIAYFDEMPLVTIMLDENHLLVMAIDLPKSVKIDGIVSQKVMPYLEKASVSI